MRRAPARGGRDRGVIEILCTKMHLHCRGNCLLMASDWGESGWIKRNGGRAKEDLGSGCVCAGARNCLSMLSLESKKGEEERVSKGTVDV